MHQTDAITPDQVAALRSDLVRYASFLSAEPALAEDLAQETIARALDSLTSFQGASSVRTWLHRILHNLWVDHARRRKEVPSDAVEELLEGTWHQDAWTLDPERVAARASERESVLEALSRLPYIYASAVLLHDAEGLRVIDIAEVHGIGLPAAKQRLRRGRMLLTSALATAPDRAPYLEGTPMTCWDARRHVSDYLDHALDSATADHVEKHLAGCPTCPPLYASLVEGVGALSRLADPDTVIPPAVAGRLRGRGAS